MAKRKFRRRPRNRRRGNGVVRKVKVLARKVRRMSPEIKNIANTQAATTVPATGTILGIGLVAEGTDSNDRIGRKTHHGSTQFRGVIGATSATNGDIVRLIVFRDKQQVTGAIPNVTDVLAIADILSEYERSITHNRFEFYYDQVRTVAQSLDAGVSQKYWKFNIFKHFDQFYDGPLSGDIDKNGLFLLSISQNANVTLEFRTQTRYTDV